MNRIFNLIWNRALKVMQVAPELTRSRGGAVASSDSPRPVGVRNRLLLACAAALALGTVAFPTWAASCTVNGITYTNCTQGTAGATGVDGSGATGSDGLKGQTPGNSTNAGTDAQAGGNASNAPIGSTGHSARSSTDVTVDVGDLVQGGTGGVAGNANGGDGGAGGWAVQWSDADGGDGGRGGNAANAAKGGQGGQAISENGFTVTNHGTILGGAGANGGNANGGHGGQGGQGANHSGMGGDGGNGGNGGVAGNGGDGGVAVSGNNYQLANQGTITGGKGGVPGTANAGSFGTGNYGGAPSGSYGTPGTAGSIGTVGAYGKGAVAVVSTGGSNIATAGTISAGRDGDNAIRANAVELSGGGNTLTLERGYSFVGNMVSNSGSTGGGDTLALGGTANYSFDVSHIVTSQPTSWTGAVQYYGFTRYTKTGSSTWTLIGADTAVTTPWSINAGTLSVSSDSSLGATGGTLTFDGGTLEITAGFSSTGRDVNLTGNGTFQTHADLTASGIISGAGSLTKSGTATLTLTGANSFTGGMAVDAGTVAAGNDTALGAGAVNMAEGTSVSFAVDGLSLANAFVLNGDPAFDVANSQTGTISGVIADGATPGVLEKDGGGTLILTGANTYSGGTTVSAGTLQGNSTSLQGNITDNATLAFNQGGDGSFAGVISGTGALSKTGSGTLILNGANTYSGSTTISAGTLEVGDASHVHASVAGTVAVQSGGALLGHGIIGGNVSNAGTVMPGGSVGVLTVNGNYTQNASGTLNIEITPNTTPGTGFSQLQVDGSASLDGTLAVQVDPGTYLANSEYDLVQAGSGVSGTFATTMYNSAFAPYLSPEVSYGTNNVTLTLKPNAQAYSGGVPNIASSVSLGVEQTFDTVLGRTGPALGGRKDAWGQYLGSWGGMGQGSHYAIHGVAAGVGVPVTDRFVLGVAVSGGTTTTTQGATRVHAKPVGGFIYGVWREGRLRIAGSFGAGWLKQDTRRTLSSLGVTQESNSHGHYSGFALRADYTAKLGWVDLSPYAGFDAVYGRYGAAQEQGMIVLALHYGRISQHLSHYQAGVRVSGSGHRWQPWVQAGVEGWGNKRAITVTERLGDYSKQVTSSPLPSSALSSGAGLDWHAGNWDTTLSWHGAWGNNYHGNSGTLQVRYRW